MVYIRNSLQQVRRTGGGMLLLGMLLLVTACHKEAPWATKNITGLMPTLSFTLTESNRNKPVHAEDYRGDILLLYFGYTHCPDVCPMTLSRLRNALAKLGDEAKHVRVLFVSIDPNRDSVEDLKRYTEYFGPQFLGLRGDQATLRELTKKYRVTYGYDKPDANGDYNVSHSSAVYVFDRDGEPRLLIRPKDTAASISIDLKRLLAEHSSNPQ